MTPSGSNTKIANSLVSASCAAVLAVYVAGYVRTETAADRFAAQVAERRVAPRIASPRDKYRSRAIHTPSDAPATAPVVSSHPEHAATNLRPPAQAWKDGTYTGWGFSRHGNIEAAVVIEGGLIASATLSQCRTRYSCSVIETLPPQVAQRQSPDVDYVSGATQSADAFYEAVVAALGKAK